MRLSYKKLCFLAALSIIIPTLSIQAQNYKKIIYDTYIGGDMDKWLVVINEMERTSKTSTKEQKQELISYYYGYIGHLIRNKNYDKAETYIPKGEKLISEALKEQPSNPTLHAYKASFIGFRITLNKLKAFTLGSESSENLELALKSDPNNIQALVDKGNSLFHMPAIFGGNKTEGLKLFIKAMKIMEQSGKTDQNWFYLNLLTVIGKSYSKLDKLQEAKLVYEKTLRKEPNYKLVKEVLYPELLRRMK